MFFVLSFHAAASRAESKTAEVQVDWKGSQYLSLEGYTVSKSACYNGQSAALLSDSGLVMYFSTLPAPSSSAPCILTILTHLHPQATPGIVDGKERLVWKAIRPRRWRRSRSVTPVLRLVTRSRRPVTPARRFVTPARRFVTYRPRDGMFTARGTACLPPVGR